MMDRLNIGQNDFVFVRFWNAPCTFCSSIKIKNYLTITLVPKYPDFSITPRFKMFFLFFATFWAKYFLHKIINFT